MKPKWLKRAEAKREGRARKSLVRAELKATGEKHWKLTWEQKQRANRLSDSMPAKLQDSRNLTVLPGDVQASPPTPPVVRILSAKNEYVQGAAVFEKRLGLWRLVRADNALAWMKGMRVVDIEDGLVSRNFSWEWTNAIQGDLFA